ncbi:MAG: hypothetical protein KKA19_05115 [Candidatus Margulisbacteria bacterium]|nr:hypothetical protein [Candidatus Margulisiibacteriota bacterium]
MYGLEKNVFEQILKLRDEYGICGLKAEFEAEGSSFRDLMRLRRLTHRADVKLYLKIGGVESVRDIKDSVEIGVDGLIAPMVESKFGVHKFQQAFQRVYGDHKLHLSINIETKNAVDQIDEILDFAKDKIDNITIGRTDLSGSYFDENIYPDHDTITHIIEKLGEKINKKNLTVTVGGNISVKSLEVFRKNKKLQEMVKRVETRKVMFPLEVVLHQSKAIHEALKFEELYILSKNEIHNKFMEAETARLTQLQRRL